MQRRLAPPDHLRQLDADLDELLGATRLVAHEPALADHVFERVTGLLVERMFCEADEAPAGAEREELLQRCRTAGLLPYPSAVGRLR